MNYISSQERKKLRAMVDPFVIFIGADIEKDRIVHLDGFDNLFTNASSSSGIDSPIPPPK